MQIFVKTLSGETLTLQVESAETSVTCVKSMIEEQEGVPVELQRMLFSGREMEDLRTLNYYNVQPDNTIHLMTALPGGGYIYGSNRQLAQLYVLNYKICRRCYGRLPPNATRCFKVKCGRTSNIRPKKTLWRTDRIPTSLSDWQKRSGYIIN